MEKIKKQLNKLKQINFNDPIVIQGLIIGIISIILLFIIIFIFWPKKVVEYYEPKKIQDNEEDIKESDDSEEIIIDKSNDNKYIYRKDPITGKNIIESTDPNASLEEIKTELKIEDEDIELYIPAVGQPKPSEFYEEEDLQFPEGPIGYD